MEWNNDSLQLLVDSKGMKMENFQSDQMLIPKHNKYILIKKENWEINIQ